MAKQKAIGAPQVERGQIRTMVLPVELTKDEILARGEELAGVKHEHTTAQQELENASEAWKETKKGMEVRIDAHEHRMRRLSTVIRAGREERDVEVFDEFDFKSGTVFTKRADTEKVVASRGMTQPERQRSLFKGVAPTPAEVDGTQASAEGR
jgi:hypothetical protein